MLLIECTIISDVNEDLFTRPLHNAGLSKSHDT